MDKPMSMSPFRLMVVSPTQTYTCTTSSKSIKIGRSLNCEFNIPKEDLSREHCLFEIENDEYFLTDLGSKNGVCVNRERITPNVRTPVDQSSFIVLSNLYTLKINAIEIKSKVDMVVRKDSQEHQTMSFNLDVDELPELVEPTPAQKLKGKKYSKKNLPEPRRIVSENLKMIIGFFLILAFIIYQARGR